MTRFVITDEDGDCYDIEAVTPRSAVFQWAAEHFPANGIERARVAVSGTGSKEVLTFDVATVVTVSYETTWVKP